MRIFIMLMFIANIPFLFMVNPSLCICINFFYDYVIKKMKRIPRDNTTELSTLGKICLLTQL